MRSRTLLLVTLLLVSFSASAQLVRSAGGADAAAVTPSRDQFRLDLGGGTVANGGPGQFIDANGTRREINWDGVPDNRAAPNALPFDFFNVNSPRGVLFSTPGTSVEVSNNDDALLADFGDIDASYTAVFEPFSPLRLFTPIGSNIVDVNFFVPGTATPALTRGFGAIFSDVDLANTTSIQLFGFSNNSLGTFFAPGFAGNGTFSFLGISFADPLISRVRITNGNLALGSGVLDQNGNANDLVVMDDFLYAEPVVRVPVPATLWLVVGALPLVVWMRRRRR